MRKTYEKLKEYSILNGVAQVERIPVKPTTIEQEVISHRTFNKWLNKWDEETETVKEKEIQVENIIEALKACKPDEVEQTIYWFNNGRFYFTTDKGIPYNLRSFPRPLTSEEEKEIETLIAEIEEDKADSEKVLFSARILIAIDTPDIFRTPEQEKELNSGEGIIEQMELSKIIERQKRLSKYFNYETWKNCYILSAKKNKEEHLELLNRTLDKIFQIFERCEEEKNFFIHPLKANRQLKIYIARNSQWFFKRLGYTVQEDERKMKSTTYKGSHGSIEKEEVELTRKSYSFQMNLNAFIASCKCGKVARKGFTFDDNGNEVEIKNGRPVEEVTIVDENGNEIKFQSKSDAAKHFNLSNKEVSQIVKNGGKLIDKMKIKMKIKIKSNDGEILSYKNLSQLAREMNENKMTVSRAFKNKMTGDKVRIGENEFEIV